MDHFIQFPFSSCSSDPFSILERLDRRQVSSCFYRGEVENELRDRHLIKSTFFHDDAKYEKVMDHLDDLRKTELYPHGDCNDHCKKKGLFHTCALLIHLNAVTVECIVTLSSAGSRVTFPPIYLLTPYHHHHHSNSKKTAAHMKYLFMMDNHRTFLTIPDRISPVVCWHYETKHKFQSFSLILLYFLGCGRLWVADGIWKLVFPHCMFVQKVGFLYK